MTQATAPVVVGGLCDHDASWEKQSVWKLDNGFTVTVEYGHYGDMVSRIDWVDGEGNPQYWHCSNGYDGTCLGSFTGELAKFAGNPLPSEFESWIEVVVPSANTTILRPHIEKRWD